MGRPRHIDRDAAVKSAMELFWLKGFEPTSMVDLEEHTNVPKASIIYAFESKYDLYIKALTRYLDDVKADAEKCLVSKKSPQSRIKSWFNKTVTKANRTRRRGCFGTNAKVERGYSDKKLNKIMTAHEKHISKLLESVVEEGQKEGTFRADLSSKELVRMISVFSTGINASSRGLLSEKEQSATCENMLKLLTK